MRNLPRALLACALFLFSLSAVWAQSIPVSSINLSGTITTGGTFQQIQGLTNNRNGCTVQNLASVTSGDLQYVYFGTCTSATTSNSVILQPQQSVSCGVAGNITLKDPVCITGTTSDAFFANFQ